MNYSDAVAYLDTTIQFGIRPGLERISALCAKLRDPQNSFNSIHIAGTNGKTSAARIISTVLSEHGLRVGTYTSPHLCSYTERFLVDGRSIAEQEFAGSLAGIIPSLEEVNRVSPEPLTHFEILTALAFYLFGQKELDCAVIEAGMGGRWDATNIIHPHVAVITNVELEHTDRLGKTIAEIAWEKAHIIKKGSVAVAGNLNKRALSVVQDRCLQEKVELRVLGNDFNLSTPVAKGMNAQIFSVNGLHGSYKHLQLPLVGEHQAENATLAIATAEAFLGRSLSGERLGSAFRKVVSPGRFETVSKNPLIVLDGAHNPAGVARLAETVDQIDFGQLILVVAILEDKNVDSMLKALVRRASFTIVTENHSERCMKAKKLAERASKSTSRYAIEESLEKALRMAMGKAKKDDMILVTGSLYTVGESRQYLEKELRH